jgi:uncharacterized integral membrane protein
LLTAVLLMALYGGLVFMPRLRANRQELRTQIVQTAGDPVANANAAPSVQDLRRLAKAQALFVYSYWSVCALMLIALLVVAWLDAREVARNYLRQQVELINEVAEKRKKPSEEG